MRPHSLPAESHSFVGMARETAAMPPALLEREKKKERKKEKFYIYLDVTHLLFNPHLTIDRWNIGKGQLFHFT